MDPKDGTFDSKREIAEAVIDTTHLRAGRHVIFVRGQDSDNNWGAFSALFLYIYHTIDIDSRKISCILLLSYTLLFLYRRIG